jgi:hypothetical protein
VKTVEIIVNELLEAILAGFGGGWEEVPGTGRWPIGGVILQGLVGSWYTMCPVWRGDRVAEGGALLRRCAGNCTEGSNPSLSAIHFLRSLYWGVLAFFWTRGSASLPGRPLCCFLVLWGGQGCLVVGQGPPYKLVWLCWVRKKGQSTNRSGLAGTVPFCLGGFVGCAIRDRHVSVCPSLRLHQSLHCFGFCRRGGAVSSAWGVSLS